MDPMIWARLLTMMVPIVLVVIAVVGVALLFPLTRRFGHYLDARTEDRRSLGRGSAEDWERVLSSLEALEKRLEGLEERQDFTERLLENPERGRRGPASRPAGGGSASGPSGRGSASGPDRASGPPGR